MGIPSESVLESAEARISDRSPLACLFSPASVAVIGATDREGSVGRSIVNNLLAGTYKGKVYAVNPHRVELFGRRCYASISGARGYRSRRDCNSSSYRARNCCRMREGESQGRGRDFRRLQGERARGCRTGTTNPSELNRGATRLVGPNCLGVMNPWIGLNGKF